MSEEDYISIGSPNANSGANAGPNGLCVCSGNAPSPDPTNSELEFQEVEVFGHDLDEPIPVEPIHVTDREPNGDWSVGEQVPCGPEPSPTENNSTVKVRALWVDWASGNPEEVYDPASDYNRVDYKAVVVPFCDAKQQTSSGRVPMNIDSSGYDSGYLFFGHLDPLTASKSKNGYRLMTNGVALRTNEIKVAAHHVHIQYGRKKLSYVRRPAGTTLAPSSESLRGVAAYRFRDLPTWSIFIWQGDARNAHVITSESIGTPDTVHLDPNSDVFVQVNYHRLFRSTLAGTFGLHVSPV